VEKDANPYLITNRHMVDIQYMDYTNQYTGFKLIEFTIDNRRRDHVTKLPTDIVDIKIANINEFVFSEEYLNDITCLKNIKTFVGDINVEFSIPFSLIATEDKINNQLSVCDFVAFPGFPDWYDKRNNIPILRTGALASDPRFNYSNTTDFKGNCIAFEAFSFGGSSGSPVFAIQKGFKVGLGLQVPDNFYREILLIGINAGHFITTEGHHSGISYLYKSSEILKLINK
jgi:hypothetical protein